MEEFLPGFSHIPNDFHHSQFLSRSRQKAEIGRKKKVWYAWSIFFLQWIIICILYTIDELVLADCDLKLILLCLPRCIYVLVGEGQLFSLVGIWSLRFDFSWGRKMFFLASRSWWDGKIHLCSLINKNVVYDQCVTLSYHFKNYAYFLMINTNYF